MPSKEIQSLRRSNFLVHWTGGKDIEPDFRSGVIDCNARREEYVKRLYTTLVKQKIVLFRVESTPHVENDLDNGRFPDVVQTEFRKIGSFNIPQTCSLLRIRDGKWLIREKGYTKYVVERKNTTLDIYAGVQGLWMNWQQIECIPEGKTLYNGRWPSTAFTEIKLSNTLEHTERYGRLGFGFSREFVMRRYGAPVQYVRGTKECDMGAEDSISANFFKSLKILGFLESKTVEYDPLYFTVAALNFKNPPGFRDFIQSIGLEQFLRQESLDQRPAEGIFGYLRASVMSCAIFIKRMSESKDDREFKLLDEAEWRIPYTSRMEEEGAVQKIYGYEQLRTQECRPACMIPFTRRDLKVLIFPDDKTRRQALDEKTDTGKCIVKWLLRDPADVPIIATVDECLQF